MATKILVIFLIFTGCVYSQSKKPVLIVKDIDGNVYHTVTIRHTSMVGRKPQGDKIS